MSHRLTERIGFFLTLAFAVALVASLVGVPATLAQAPPNPSKLSFEKPSRGGFGDFGSFGSFRSTASAPYTAMAAYTLEKGGQRGRLTVSVELAKGYSIYSVSQPKGGPIKTTIGVSTTGVKLEGPFTPDQPPKISNNETGFEGVQVEKHFDQIHWTAPIQLDKSLAQTPGELEITIDGQVCKDNCVPIDQEKILAAFQGFYASASASAEKGPFRDPDARTSWAVELAKSTVAPGESTTIDLRSSTENGFHIYAVRPKDKDTSSSTVIVLRQKSALPMGTPEPTSPPIQKEMIPGELTVSYHEADIGWRIPIHVPNGASEGLYPIEGLVGYQACTDDNCEEPLGLRFRGELQVSKAKAATTVSNMVVEKIAYDEVIKSPQRLTWIDDAKQPAQAEPPLVIAPAMSWSQLLPKFCLAILGGFILNFMPCVLPVIGLKILSFVKESDRSGASAIILNIWYIAGIMTVFLGLGAFTIAFRVLQGDAFGWGEQFGSQSLRLGLTILMFAMSLSFLGVWEIPIPGFATSQTSSELMQREGPMGAFSKGLLTTVLATPCSGPGLAAVFSVAIAQPAWVILLMYFGVGLGMSLPFILICFAPELVRYLPKPGAWMQSFKEFLAFPMLFAVVWLFLTTFKNEKLIAVIFTLIGVWFACWWIGRVPVWSNFGKKSLHWMGAAASAYVIGYVAFNYYGNHEKRIEWIPYSAAQLAELQAQDKTVMIDFTAEWCANCKVNLLTAIETQEVADLIEAKNIIPMIADFTDRPLEIKNKLHELESNSIPILAIYPAKRHDKPIVLRDLVTKRAVLAALREATEHDAKTSKIDSQERSLPVSISHQAPP
jgi:suppressor for copper-sensitivity B